ncbi:prolipoprotein diacylglyceryl transferase [Candidatus Peregrinibacteria bacterium CG_4_10_14_0_2_um_filter_38_24]|nr:MAG: prolipoprotein diacylglyceryl transferase [Candidatus Peregrinibacteria bacterium CG_4_10_14_0_2_um_filter_38_24]PJC38777.1 MAG: prolipoprotein diacylglyceryl transferase [Candidatus Peregrinibacteria bacterium CG_4_9_14_0_2_um_filter_38_9]
MIFINDISLEIFRVGEISLRWYGLFFALGIALAYTFIGWVFKKEKFKAEDLDSIAIYLFFGLLIGARLGEVLFYDPKFFFEHPSEIIKTWHGGLSSHGATIGLFLAYVLWTKIHKVPFTKYADALAMGIPITAFFVRVGNFFNSEIVGYKIADAGEKVSGVGVIFKQLGEDFPRHPAQLYEAFLLLIIFAFMVLIYKKSRKKNPKLFFLFFFVGLYFSGRFFIEFYKDLHVFPDSFPFSMGQVLSIVPILLAGIYFIFFWKKGRRK